MEEDLNLRDMKEHLPPPSSSSGGVLEELLNFELRVTAPESSPLVDSVASSPAERYSMRKGIDEELERILNNDPDLMLSPPPANNNQTSRSFNGPINYYQEGGALQDYTLQIPSRGCKSLPPVISSLANNNPYPVNVVEKIKSRNLVNNRPPTFKQVNLSSRTNLKQMLYREQSMQEEQKYPLRSAAASASRPIQTESPPQRSDIIRDDVPREVLNVSTRLQNPTKSFVLETQRQQVQEYLNHERNLLPLEARAGPSHQPNAGDEFLDDFLSNDTSLEDGAVPDIKGMDTSINMTGNEVNASTLLDFITNFENSTQNDNDNDSNNNNNNSSCDNINARSETLAATKTLGTTRSETKASAPDDVTVKEEPLTDEDLKAMQKDRQKKDNHNMIERRRRFNINDRIKELGTLLPKQQDHRYYDIVRDVRQNKGSILKASVDYIKHLKEDQIKKRALEEEFKSIKLENRKLILQLQEYEKQFKAYGIPLQTFSWNAGSTNTDIPDIGVIKEEPGLVSKELCDLMEDDEDNHPVSNGDPMLSSPHLSPREGLMSNSSPSSSHYSNEDNNATLSPPDSMDLAA